jgi:hypothetical protein
MSDEGTAALGDNSGTPPPAPANTPPANSGTPPAPTNQSNWTEGLGDDSTAFIQNKGWDSPGKMLESYRNLEKFAGGSKDLVELPGADATPEQMDSFFNKMGRPETPDKYDLKMPEGGDKELDGWFRETAHKHGISSKQAQGLYEDWNGMAEGKMASMAEQSAAQGEKDIASLKKEWGQTYNSQIDAGKNAVRALGYKQEELSALESEMGTANMLKLFARMGSKMGESSFETGDKGSNSFGTTPAQANAQISDLKLDKGFMGKYLSGDKDAIAKMSRLMEAANA